MNAAAAATAVTRARIYSVRLHQIVVHISSRGPVLDIRNIHVYREHNVNTIRVLVDLRTSYRVMEIARV